MAKAAASSGTHYLATINLVKLDINNPAHPLTGFIDSAIELIRPAAGDDGNLQTEADNSVDVYAVIDGQQRLTTLFLLGHWYYKHVIVHSPHINETENQTLVEQSAANGPKSGGGSERLHKQ